MRTIAKPCQQGGRTRERKHRDRRDRLCDSLSEQSYVQTEQRTCDDTQGRFVRDDQDVACSMPGSDRFHDAHSARGHIECCLSSRSTATRDIVGPIFEGLRPSLPDVSLSEALPLPIVNFFQPILEVCLNAREPGTARRRSDEHEASGWYRWRPTSTTHRPGRTLPPSPRRPWSEEGQSFR